VFSARCALSPCTKLTRVFVRFVASLFFLLSWNAVVVTYVETGHDRFLSDHFKYILNSSLLFALHRFQQYHYAFSYSIEM
jgi:hypothetical protein